MEKIKLLIACHKQAKLPDASVYYPIHVGKVLHPELNLGFSGDDTGDNISELNPYYCELTAEYWGWKNLDCEYIGLQHYRRYFDFHISESGIDALFDQADVYLANPLHLSKSVYDYLKEALVIEDVYIFLKVIEHLYPDYYKTVEKYMTGNLFYPCNMFLCKKSLFDEFAKWQFDILKGVRSVIKFSEYSREKRILGFLGECLLPIYFLHHGLRIKTLPVVSMPGSSKQLLTTGKILALRRDLKARRWPRKLDFSEDVLLGLERDGIMANIKRL